MNPLYTAIASAMRRRSSPAGRDQPSLVRLLAGEVAWAARQAIHPVKLVAAAIVAVGVGLVLGPTTPGPVLGSGWRLGLAVVVGFFGLALVHALLQRSYRARSATVEENALHALRIVVAVVVTLLVGTFVTAYLLAAVTGAPAGAGGDGLAVSLPIDWQLLVGAGLLLVGVLTAGAGRRLALPGSLLFLVIGMVAGSDGLGLVSLDDAGLALTIGVVALVVILFDGGLSTTPEHLRAGIGPGLALATVGVGVTAGVTALAATALLDVPARTAWLLGAIVASTDASAVFSLLKRVPVPRRLEGVLQLESGMNDPVAILLTVGLLASWDAPPTASAWLGFGATQLVGGVVVGALVGVVGAWLLRTVELGEAGLYAVLALAVAGVAYGVATSIGASGFLATYLAGIVVGAEAPRRRGTVRAFVGALANGMEVGLFLVLGLLVFPSRLPGVALVALGFVAILVLVARPVAVALSLAWFDFSRAEVAAVSWLGMRGAVPIVLATLSFSAGLAEADVVFDVVFFVVLVSILVQGLGAPKVVAKLGLERAATSPAGVVVEALPLDAVGVDVLDVEVPAHSALVGNRLSAMPPSADVLVVAVVRGDEVLVPGGAMVFKVGDRLAAATPDQEHGLARVEAWVSTGVMPAAREFASGV